MSPWGMLQLGVATIIFLAAATVAKQWAMAPHVGRIVLALALYSAGNLIMLKLVRDFGMATAFSLSAIIQLVAVNLIAIIYFGERLGVVQGAGVVLAVVAVAMIALGPAANAQ
jgi:multidrug transporter EmrE-like cation transporter